MDDRGCQGVGPALDELGQLVEQVTNHWHQFCERADVEALGLDAVLERELVGVGRNVAGRPVSI
jgi:hypothetical protein